jgi:ribosomal protein S18 acetylase RimI-like enzyme
VVIQELCVSPEFRRQGLGSYLIDVVLQRMKAAGESDVHVTVTATNDTIRRLNEAAGFQPTRTIPYASKIVAAEGAPCA